MLTNIECADPASVRALACAWLTRIQLTAWLTARENEAEQQRTIVRRRLSCALRGDLHPQTLTTEEQHLWPQLKLFKSPEAALLPC